MEIELPPPFVYQMADNWIVTYATFCLLNIPACIALQLITATDLYMDCRKLCRGTDNWETDYLICSSIFPRFKVMCSFTLSMVKQVNRDHLGMTNPRCSNPKNKQGTFQGEMTIMWVFTFFAALCKYSDFNFGFHFAPLISITTMERLGTRIPLHRFSFACNYC